MTRIFTDGAEFNDMLFWTSPSGWAVTAGGRSGSYSYYHNGSVATKDTPDLSEAYLRFAHNTQTIGDTDDLISFRHSITTLASMAVNASSKLTAKINGVVVDTGINAFTINIWHLIEIYLKIDDAPNGRFVVYLDGILEIDYTGDTKPGADTHFDNLAFYRFYTGGYYFFDDLALNDTNGAVDNSWCGDGHVIVLMPDANGDVNDWDGSDGDSVNNYLLVDERPHDSDTTYVKTTVTEQDMYNVSDYDPTGGKIVRRIFAECRARDATAGAGAIKIGYKHGGTVYLCTDARIITSNYTRIVGDDALLDPSDSTIWSEADLDAIQFVVECSSSSSSTSSSSSSSSTTSSSSSTEIP